MQMNEIKEILKNDSISIGDNIWSYSKFNTFQTCPLLFKFKYIDKIPIPTDEWLFIGNIVDSSIRISNFKYPEYVDDSIYKIIYDYNLEIEEEKCKLKQVPFPQISSTQEEIINMCKSFTNTYRKFIENKIIPLPDKIPKKLQCKKIPDTEYYLQGFLDGFSTESNTIIEIKTANRQWNEQKIKDHYQPDIYGWLEGNNPDSITIVFLKNQSSNNIQIIKKKYSESRIKSILKIYKNISTLYNIMKHIDLWYPTPNYLCSLCHYKDKCEEWGK